RETVPPAEFIGLAEQTGLIVDLGDWVLRTALRDVGDWARRGLIGDEFELSVNVSARQLVDPRFPDVVADALGAWSRPAAGLCLEITESAVVADRAAIEHTFAALHRLGVGLAIDDFGVGYSSLGQLTGAMPVSVCCPWAGASHRAAAGRRAARRPGDRTRRATAQCAPGCRAAGAADVSPCCRGRRRRRRCATTRPCPRR